MSDQSVGGYALSYRRDALPLFAETLARCRFGLAADLVDGLFSLKFSLMTRIDNKFKYPSSET